MQQAAHALGASCLQPVSKPHASSFAAAPARDPCQAELRASGSPDMPTAQSGSSNQAADSSWVPETEQAAQGPPRKRARVCASPDSSSEAMPGLAAVRAAAEVQVGDVCISVWLHCCALVQPQLTTAVCRQLRNVTWGQVHQSHIGHAAIVL